MVAMSRGEAAIKTGSRATAPPSGTMDAEVVPSAFAASAQYRSQSTCAAIHRPSYAIVTQPFALRRTVPPSDACAQIKSQNKFMSKVGLKPLSWQHKLLRVG